MSFAWAVVIALVAWIVYRILGPSVRLVWASRRVVALALWFHVRHPIVWRRAKERIRVITTCPFCQATGLDPDAATCPVCGHPKYTEVPHA